MDRNDMKTLHPMLMHARTDAFARELFWDDLTMFLEAEARPLLRSVFEKLVRPSLVQTLGREPDRYEIAKAMREQDANRWWYLLRTQSQREGILATRAVIGEQLPVLIERAKASSNGPGSLSLNSEVQIPGYLDVDIHLQTGGYAGVGEEKDGLAQGAIYDRGMTLGRMGTQGWLNDDPGLSLAAFVQERFPDLKPNRILEMGCTVGHAMGGFKQTFPDAKVHGLDVAAPGLRYGFARAANLGLDLHFHQMDATSTDFEDGSFDLVYSRILLHETSADAVPAIFAECHRLLRKGGLMFHSDAPQFNELDPYVQSLRDWDATVNNEPFMDGYYAMDLEAEFEKADFAREDMFRAFTPSLQIQAGDFAVKKSRATGGRYFLAGAEKS